MKLIKKNYKFVLGIIIGGLLGSIGVYAGSLMNSNEVAFTPKNNKWNVTKVDEALNSLYTAAVPEEYNGITEITPTYSDITLNTQDKLLKNNITISGIPSTYKNLTSTTTVTADKLSSGETAYNSDGNLITGTAIFGSQCVSGTYNHVANTQTNIYVGFEPSKLLLVQKIDNVIFFIYMNKDFSDAIFNAYTSASGNKNINNVSSYFDISSNILIKWTTTNGSWYTSNYSINYMACK